MHHRSRVNLNFVEANAADQADPLDASMSDLLLGFRTRLVNMIKWSPNIGYRESSAAKIKRHWLSSNIYILKNMPNKKL